MDQIFFTIPLVIYLLAGDMMTSKGEVVKDVVGSLTFEQVENINNRSLTTKGREIHYLLQDEFIGSNVLLAKGHAIYTLDLISQEFHLIAGNENSFGYRNGVGSDVRFWNIGGMITMPNDPSMTLVSDSNNFCIRIIKRASNFTCQFAGKCRNSGYVDGSISKAQFSYITDVARKQIANGWRMYTWDVGSTYNVLRYIDIVDPTNNSAVGTVASTQGQASMGVKSLDFFPNSNTLCVGILSAIFTVNLDKSLIRPILHGSTPVDGQFSTSGVGTILGAAFLDETTLLVADALFWKLRVIDFASHQISSICLTNSYTRTKFTPGTLETCILSRPTFLLNQPLARRVLIATNTGIYLLKYNVKEKSAVTPSPMMENTDYQTQSPKSSSGSVVVSPNAADNRVREMNVSIERGKTSTPVEPLISSEQLTHPLEVTSVNTTKPMLSQLTNESRFPAKTSLSSVAVSQTSTNSHINQTDTSMKRTKKLTSASLVTTERMTHPPEVTSADTKQIMSQSTTQSTSPAKTSVSPISISQTTAGRHSHEINVSTVREQKTHHREVTSESTTKSKASRPANQSTFSEISVRITANGKTSFSTNTVVQTSKPLTKPGEINGAEDTPKTITTFFSSSTTSGKSTRTEEMTSAQKSATNIEPIAVTNSKVVGPDDEIKSAARRIHIHKTLHFILACAIQMIITYI